ncbi:MAG TPA: hypothetical protein VMB21_18630 [Candidatus Limnocylindria bacterium]|jgi:hypothetical protein|nr:hypothetical protein [Candidatus Limnocylindria bacterium]
MASESETSALAAPHRIELSLRNVGQLFNTLDPSPFHDKDLDHDAEEFIESWALEFKADAPVTLTVHLEELPAGPSPQPLVEQAVHNYFLNRARLNRLEFRRLMAEGRKCLVIGLLFLGACLALSELVIGRQSGTLADVLRESLTIGGWVAMWRPLEIYLYDWWPLRERGRIFEKLSTMPVEVRRKA